MADERLEPVWRLLDANSLSGLMASGKQLPAALRIIHDGKVSHVTAPLVGAAETILARAQQEDGLRLTASGFINLKDVAAIFDAMPGYEAEKDMIRYVCRVINERDFPALHLARLVLQKAGLLYRRKDRLFCRKAARDPGAHYSEIVASTFWRTGLSECDGIPLPHWPQDHVGVILWALSACGLQWSQPNRLMALSTLSRPTPERVDPDWLLSAFELRVLRPLVWLGLLETERPWEDLRPGANRLRKTPLFDQTFAFEVTLRDRPAADLH